MEDSSQDRALIAAKGADEAGALDTVVLDMRALTAVCDYFVICHGRSAIHIRSVADGIEEAMQRHQVARHHREGRAQATWVVLDYVDVIVHVFTEEARNFYVLERLWGDAPRIQPPRGVPGDPE